MSKVTIYAVTNRITADIGVTFNFKGLADAERFYQESVEIEADYFNAGYTSRLDTLYLYKKEVNQAEFDAVDESELVPFDVNDWVLVKQHPVK